jgi:hypothetical protein
MADSKRRIAKQVQASTIPKALGKKWEKGSIRDFKSKIRIEGKGFLKSSLRGRRFVVRPSWVGGSVSSC